MVAPRSKATKRREKIIRKLVFGRIEANLNRAFEAVKDNKELYFKNR